MSEKYIPLYRKYRPKNLQEVVGQEHVKKALTNAINLNRISHAYLFTGPRGTGKTSIARILAKSLNCMQGPTITPCEICPSCVDIKNSTPMDVIEIDAASNRKVEDAQNILEKIQYVPVNGKYKIYIIDEVHMLTNHAFNALLKTLEEPPENVIFILATTEPQKVLETITSRCQRFDFRRITTDDIINHLKYVAQQEKINIDNEALFTIAKNSAGGMRDSLALLDQVSVLDSAETITAEDVNKLLGRLSFDLLKSLSQCIIQSEAQYAIELLEKIYNSGNEPSQILINMMGYFKNLLIVKNCQGEEILIELTQLNSAQIKELKHQAEEIETHQITFLIEKIIYYIKELKTTTNQHLWLEIALIDMSNLAQNSSLLALQERVTKLETALASGNISAPTAKTYPNTPLQRPKTPQQPAIIPEKEENKPSTADSSLEKHETSAAPEISEEKMQQEPIKEELPSMPISKHETKIEESDLGTLWFELLHNISSAPTVSLLNQHAKPIEISSEKIIIACKENFAKMLGSESKKACIEEGATKLFGKKVNVSIKTGSSEDFKSTEKKNPIIEPKQPAALGKQITDTPPEYELSEEDEYIEHELKKNLPAKEKYVPSDQVSMIINLFDGKYID